MTIKLKPMKGDDPSWFSDGVIHHELDKDLHERVKATDGLYESMFILDPAFDVKRMMYHLYYSEDDCVKFWEGMICSALEFIRNAKPKNQSYQDAIDFINSELFEVICSAIGWDCEQIRQGTEKAMKGYNKPFKAKPVTVKKETDVDIINTMFRYENNNVLPIELY